ncbi:MAG TPA: hypothetical protein VD757_02670, partial [Candidatus Nitrosocosmicus sp.]|nr:hypothetical protein [Candidatus Nitrosocosmicus sp.]
MPTVHLNLIKEKIGDTWHGITITKVDSIPEFTPQAVRYKLTYRKEDALSLSVDRRTNTLLGSILNVIDVIEEGDKVGVFYNFIPVSQYSWRADHQRTLKKLDDNYPVDREKFSVSYALKMILTILLEVVDIATDALSKLFGESKENQQVIFQMPLLQQPKPLLPATSQKKDASIIETQMLVLSESSDRIRGNNNAYSVCEAFKSISGDNELIYHRYNHKSKVDFLHLRLPGVDAIKTSPEECQNLIALPGRELLEEHKIIEKIDTYESEVPEELQKGVICVGENTYRGSNVKACLTTDNEFKNLALVIIGPTRAGKTTLIANIANDTVGAGECTILFDFCGNSELSSEVAAKFPKYKVLVIDCENDKTLQGLGYNEVYSSSTDTFKSYRNAKVQASQLMTLCNALNSEDKELAARMERYLGSAALVVFISNGPIRDVFSVVQNHT